LQVTEITDEGLLKLVSLPRLSSLNVSLTSVSKAGAEEFRRASPGVELEFGSCDVQLAIWLMSHATVPQTSVGGKIEYPTLVLKRLRLPGTKEMAGIVSQVTDASLGELALLKLSELEELDLRETAITDRGLQALVKKLTALKRLDLRGTAISEQAIGRLAESLPTCEILTPR
jgi:hypothetical protein